jgi:hypothetical protein
MALPKPKTFVLIGFTISLVSIILNSLLLSYFNNELRRVDSEHQNLVDGLARQNSKWNEADSQFNLYLIAHNLSLLPGATDEAKDDAAVLLGDSLISYHLAANDISAIDASKAQVEIAGRDIAELQKQEPPSIQPLSALADKIQSLRKLALLERTSPSGNELLKYLLPQLKDYREQWMKTIDDKTTQVRSLRERRATLASRQSLLTYLAIGLQVLGLMLILAKDLSKTDQNAKTTSGGEES